MIRMSGARSRRIAGVIVLVTGLLLVVERAGTVGAVVALIRVWWPAGLAAFAAVNLATFLREPVAPSPLRWPVWALVALLLLAGVTLLRTTGVIRFEIGGYLLPVAVVGVGLLVILWEGSFAREHQRALSVTAVLRRSVVNSAAKGIYHVRVLVIFGEARLDLSRSTLHSGTEVHATVWCGRFHLRYPTDWGIDKARPVGPRLEVRERNSATPGPGKTLLVRAMGGYGDVVLVAVDD